MQPPCSQKRRRQWRMFLSQGPRQGILKQASLSLFMMEMDDAGPSCSSACGRLDSDMSDSTRDGPKCAEPLDFLLENAFGSLGGIRARHRRLTRLSPCRSCKYFVFRYFVGSRRACCCMRKAKSRFCDFSSVITPAVTQTCLVKAKRRNVSCVSENRACL